MPAGQALEGVEPHEWVCFERALVVRDIFTGGGRTFQSTQDAQAFRAGLYMRYGAPACLPACVMQQGSGLRAHTQGPVEAPKLAVCQMAGDARASDALLPAL